MTHATPLSLPARLVMALSAMTLAITAFVASPAARADNHAADAVAAGELANAPRKRLRGAFEIVALEDGGHVLRFDEAFLASRGPDVKVFLSPQAFADVTGDTAVNGAVNLGELQAFRGAQDFEIPADVDLAAFSSVIVHCEEYAVLWGGADL